MKEKKIQAVKFRVKLSGHGVVNFDGDDQKLFNWKHCGSDYSKNENQKYCKKEYYKLYETDKEYEEAVKEYAELNDMTIDEAKKRVPEYGYHLKISNNSLRHEIFNGTSDADSLIWQFPGAATSFIANPLSYMRGYMCASKEKNFNKKSCVNVTDAVDKNAVITTETYTKSGDRDCTSFFTRETAGETNYTAEVYFDVEEAQFLACDDYFGRRAIASEYVEGENLLAKAFERNYGRIPFKEGIYTNHPNIFNGSYGQYGLLMDDDFINTLIKTLAKQLLSINIIRITGNAHTTEVEYKPIYSAEDNMSDEGWIKLNSPEEIPDFEIKQYYETACHNDWDGRQKAIAEKKKAEAEKKANKKSAKNK